MSNDPRDRENDEQAFLAGYDAEDFDRPSLAVDVAILTLVDGAIQVAVVERDEHPHRGRRALPGGFVGLDESLDAAAARVLDQKAGIRGVYLEQLYTFGRPDRDPRTRVVSVAYYALVPEAELSACVDGALDFVRIEVPWSGEAGGAVVARDAGGELVPLAFDHAEILGMAMKRLRGKLDYTRIGFQLLPHGFTLRALQDVHETIRDERLNKDSFRRRMLATGWLEETGDREDSVGHRPAALYRAASGSAD